MKKTLFLLAIVICLILPACTDGESKDNNSVVTSNSTAERIDTSGNSMNKGLGISESSSVIESKNSQQNELTSSKISGAQNNTNQEISSSSITDSYNNQEKSIDLENIINKNYVIKDIHYEVSDYNLNETTGRKEYDIYVRPENIEIDKYIKDQIENNPDCMQNDKVKKIFETANNIISDIPKEYPSVHIYMVSWVSYDKSFSFTIVQDKAQDTIK